MTMPRLSAGRPGHVHITIAAVFSFLPLQLFAKEIRLQAQAPWRKPTPRYPRGNICQAPFARSVSAILIYGRSRGNRQNNRAPKPRTAGVG